MGRQLILATIKSKTCHKTIEFCFKVIILVSLSFLFIVVFIFVFVNETEFLFLLTEETMVHTYT